MKATDLIGNQTYQVIDEPNNRFNFIGLIEVDEELAENIEDGENYDLACELPEDVQRAVNVMAENDVTMSDFTGISVFEDGATFYTLTW